MVRISSLVKTFSVDMHSQTTFQKLPFLVSFLDGRDASADGGNATANIEEMTQLHGGKAMAENDGGVTTAVNDGGNATVHDDE